MERVASLATPPDISSVCEADPGSAYLLSVIAAGGGGPAIQPEALHALQATVASWQQPPWPADLVGRPCPQAAPRWHLDQLLATEADDAKSRAKRLFHARMAGFLLQAGRDEFRPLVTVLIPVYNRAAQCAEAIASCLAQTWRPIEIVVIDDGSTDNLAETLAPFGDAVRLGHQPNRGAGSARNAGLQLASGDFVHFLDSDNLLMPEAVERKVDGFARIADAALCYSLAQVVGDLTLNHPRTHPADGSPDCPTTDLVPALHRLPFYVSCVMLPRWVALKCGGFEEDLRRGEDSRYWINLALQGTKTIAVNAPLTTRRLAAGSISADKGLVAYADISHLRNCADLLSLPQGWCAAAKHYPGVLHVILAVRRESVTDDMLIDAIRRVQGGIAALGDGRERDGMSPLPLLAHLRHLTRGAINQMRRQSQVDNHDLESLLATIDSAARSAAPLGRSDVQFWGHATLRDSKGERVNRFLKRVDRALDRDPALLPVVEELLRRSQLIPSRRLIDIYLWFRRFLFPPRLAMRLAHRISGRTRRRNARHDSASKS